MKIRFYYDDLRFSYLVVVSKEQKVVLRSLFDCDDFREFCRSNASDAIDKLKFLGVTELELLKDVVDLDIRIQTDKDNGIITIMLRNKLLVRMVEKYLPMDRLNFTSAVEVVCLSATAKDLPRSVVCNVHGVNLKFLKIGEKMAIERQSGQQVYSKGAYFLGRMVWEKGYRELIDLLAKHKSDLDSFNMDVFSNGEDAHEIMVPKNYGKFIVILASLVKGNIVSMGRIYQDVKRILGV
ncbi:hypothetical protein FXO38_14909 [Capsicum annuum]|nr:hypothetical protein FXO37_19888 [Capsicum annuum]KAF3654917.1 hypothetical protein FXO38_14909 [Capsicum annuum]